MSEKDLVSREVLEQCTQDILKTVVEHLYDYEEYSDEFISDLFQLTPEEAKSISDLINDEVVSKYKLWSSQGTTNKINEAKLESQNYANELIKDLSSIQLEWCETALPTTGEVNKIYILPVTSYSTTVNTLNIWNSTDNAYVSIGNLEIDLTTLYTKSEIDSMLADYAKKTEVLSIDNVITDTSKATGTNVLSASTSVSELDKKIDKTSIVTTIDISSTEDTVPSAKTTHTELDKKVDKSNIVSVLDSTVTNEQLIDGKTLVDKFNDIDTNFALRYNYDDKKYKSVSDRKSAIKSVMKLLIKDGATTANVDYYKNNALFIIRYNGGYYFTYIMTSFYSKIFLLEIPFYDTDVNIWVEDENSDLFIKGTIPITEVKKYIVNPFTLNTDKYKLYDGYYTISGTTCSLTVSIDCISPADSSTDVGSLTGLNFKIPSTPRTFDLKAEDDETKVMRFYLGTSACQVWLGTAGKRYTGTITYTIK